MIYLNLFLEFASGCASQERHPGPLHRKKTNPVWWQHPRHANLGSAIDILPVQFAEVPPYTFTSSRIFQSEAVRIWSPAGSRRPSSAQVDTPANKT